MKKAVLFIGALFFVLMTIPSFAQNTSKKQKESKTKTEILQNNTASKVEERGIAAPDHWHNSNSKASIARISQTLAFQNAAFRIKSSTEGFDLYKNGFSSVYAKLVPTPKEGLYRYSSSTINGAAHFDAKGNLILKYLDNETGKRKEITFKAD